MDWAEMSIDITKFTSDDGKHEVIWHKPEGYSYEVWWCKTHEKEYYKSDCTYYPIGDSRAPD
jgi:hypothetical protein